jgi:hypothetical protein
VVRHLGYEALREHELQDSVERLVIDPEGLQEDRDTISRRRQSRVMWHAQIMPQRRAGEKARGPPLSAEPAGARAIGVKDQSQGEVATLNPQAARVVPESLSDSLGRRLFMQYWIAVAGTGERPIDNYRWAHQAKWKRNRGRVHKFSRRPRIRVGDSLVCQRLASTASRLICAPLLCLLVEVPC